MNTFGGVPTNMELDQQIILFLDDFRLGATAPSAATIGSTPTLAALLFDATNEIVSMDIMVPRDFDSSINSKLQLIIALSATETDADTLDLTCDYLAASVGDLLTKTSSQVTGQVTVTAALGLAIATQYTIDIPFDHTDATNPINANTKLISTEIHLTNITEVAEFHLISGCFAYQSTH